MSDRIAADMEKMAAAAVQLEAQLQEWKSIRAGIAQEVLEIMRRQQADATEFFGYITEDFFTTRSRKLEAIVEDHISQIKLMLQVFRETDKRLAERQRGK